MSGKSKKKVVYYGIDIGAPSKGDGFYAVKWDGKEIIHCDRFETDTKKTVKELKKWNATIDTIVKDAKKHEVHIALEAPLFGFDCRTAWKPRFSNIESIDPKKKAFLEERPYYTSAGGASGFIAQIFLAQLLKKIKEKSKNIFLYESYVSGFNGTEKKTEQRKKKKSNDIYPNMYHKTDAFESLAMLLTYKEEKKLPPKTEDTIKLSQPIWIDCLEKDGLMPLGFTFYFNPQNVILISRRYSNPKKDAKKKKIGKNDVYYS